MLEHRVSRAQTRGNLPSERFRGFQSSSFSPNLSPNLSPRNLGDFTSSPSGARALLPCERYILRFSSTEHDLCMVVEFHNSTVHKMIKYCNCRSFCLFFLNNSFLPSPNHMSKTQRYAKSRTSSQLSIMNLSTNKSKMLFADRDIAIGAMIGGVRPIWFVYVLPSSISRDTAEVTFSVRLY